MEMCVHTISLTLHKLGSFLNCKTNPMATTSSESSGQGAATSKKVLITGVSKGLGRALALELARRGHTVIGCSRDQSKLDSLQQQLSKLCPKQHLILNIDVVCKWFYSISQIHTKLIEIVNFQRSNSNVGELARAVLENKLVPDIIGIFNYIQFPLSLFIVAMKKNKRTKISLLQWIMQLRCIK